MFLWVCTGVSSKLPGAPDPALSRDDPGGLLGSRPIPLGVEDTAAAGTPLARSPSGRKPVRTWLGGGHRAVGGPTGSHAGSAFSPPGQSTAGQPLAPCAAAPVHLFALPPIACYQQLRRAGDPAHGDGAQNLGRQSNGDRRPHAADFGQRLTHLLAARQGCLWPVGEVTALCSTHLAGNRPHRTITLSGPATCSTPAPFDRRNHPRPPKPIQRDSRAYAEVCLARGKHSRVSHRG